MNSQYNVNAWGSVQYIDLIHKRCCFCSKQTPSGYDVRLYVMISQATSILLHRRLEIVNRFASPWLSRPPKVCASMDWQIPVKSNGYISIF